MIGLSKPHKRMVDAELILRYFTFTTNYDPATRQVKNYSGKVKNALNRFCEQRKNITHNEAARLTHKFEETIDKIQLTLGETAFQRINADDTTDGRLNRAIMDCIMLSFERQDRNSLMAKKDRIRALLRELSIEDQNFSDAITYGTADKRRLEYRLNIWHDRLASLCRGQ